MWLGAACGVGAKRSIHCDVCATIHDQALEVHLLPDVPVQTEKGTIIAHRRGVQQLLPCGGCGEWLRSALDHLKRAMA
ncbi:MAG: hypothetical protein EXR63_00980 [Dehalococcoidia bacterium]|nr:hypothetical protein [Dehalococcoidia bacterium]